MTAKTKVALATLFNAFPPSDTQDARAVAELYIQAVADIEPHYVVKATWDFVRGTAGREDNRFRPTPAEFAARARHHQDRDRSHKRFVDERKAIEGQSSRPYLPGKQRPREVDRMAHVAEVWTNSETRKRMLSSE